MSVVNFHTVHCLSPDILSTSVSISIAVEINNFFLFTNAIVQVRQMFWCSRSEIQKRQMFGKEDTFGIAYVCEAEFSSMEIYFYNSSGKTDVWYSRAVIRQVFSLVEANV